MKYFISTCVTLSLFFAAAPRVLAQNLCPSGQFEALCDLRIDQDNNYVGVILTILLILAIILALIFFVWGGINWIRSGGDKGKIDQARGTLTAAVIGLILALLAFFFVNIVAMIFTGSSITTLTIPRLID